jgi:conjugative relaxase-like TrwC/TraI family protein
MMGIHKLTAGDGYLYLIRQTAAHDASVRGRASLGDYYTEKGEVSGRWMGRGLPGLSESAARIAVSGQVPDVWTVDEGSEVTEDQMKSLFGLGWHPNADKIMVGMGRLGAPKSAAVEVATLGRPFRINDATTELHRRLAVAFRDHNLSVGEHWNAPIPDTLRAQMKTDIGRELFLGQYGREPLDARELTGFIARQSREQTTSVAGYDLTFTPVKSVSVLWALAPYDIASAIEGSHNQAVADALEFLQDNAAFTRLGAGGIAQLDTDGFLAAAFTHRDSRAGDPNLHTHVAVSNKVRTRDSQGFPVWMALDGRTLFKHVVAASELYNTRIEGYLNERLAVSFEDRPTAEGRRPVREIAGISTELAEQFSSRRVAITDRFAELAKQFLVDHGREPTTPEAIALSQQATLETRAAKHEPRSLAEQRQQWRTQAREVLGSEHAVGQMLGTVLAPARVARPAAEITDEWIDSEAARIIATVSQSRSSWQRTHIYAEAQRCVRRAGYAADPALAQRLTDAALGPGLSQPHARVGDTDVGEPQVLRRRDGTSVYHPHGTDLFTSAAMLAAEKRILDAATRQDGHRLSPDVVDMALLGEQAHRGRTLTTSQETMVREMACSGARVQLALAPAGTGKTTAMSVLARAWRESGGTVIGLSPSANAAQILRADINDADTDTIDKFVWLAAHPDIHDDPARRWFDRIDASTLIIIDEAGKAATLALDAVLTTALARGATVRMIGDDRQLSSISAGGVLRDIAETVGALLLTEVLRFVSLSERHATTALRVGDPSAIAFYADNHRIHVSAEGTATDAAYQAWRADRARGADSLLLAPTNEAVSDLNERARLDRLHAELVAGNATDGAEAVLSDGLRASVGDIVATRKNRRSLRIGGARDFVRNGYRWTVAKVWDSGALTVAHLTTGQKVSLPAGYVREYTTLGYAFTIDGSQGMTVGNKRTVGTCHVVGAESMSRQQLYTGLTRGTHENHIYFSTAETDEHRILAPKATHPDTAIDVMTRILSRDDAQVSATTASRQAEDPTVRLASAAHMYLDALGEAAQLACGHDRLAELEAAASSVYPALTESLSWPQLRKHLAILAANGHDAAAIMTAAAATRELDSAEDPAAVLDWRIDLTASAANVGPLQWLPCLPPRLAEDPQWGHYLNARAALVTELADQIRVIAAEWDHSSVPGWAYPIFSSTPTDSTRVALIEELAVFRAAFGVDDADTRLTGPQLPSHRPRRIQQMLEQAGRGRIGHSTTPTKRFDTLIDALDPRVRRDPYWPQLATHLGTVARTGVNLGQLLDDVAGYGPLPDEMPGAALWWRLCGHLSPATLETNSTRLRPVWLTDLNTLFGTATAEIIAADPAFPGLVAAVDNTVAVQRWNPRALLEVADEALRDNDPDNTLRAGDHARLLTYAIGLFAAEHPYDHTIPFPDAPPLTAEEDEELRHRIPDPQRPIITALSTDDMLAILGVISDTAPLLAETGPPDPLDYDELVPDDATGLAFEDLLHNRPPTAVNGLDPALTNLDAVRHQLHQATTALYTLAAAVATNSGPAALAARPHILALRERADCDRPYLLALCDVVARYSDADHAYQQAVSYHAWTKAQLAQCEANPNPDPLDIISARQLVELAAMAIPIESPAQQFQPELDAVRDARAQAAGGTENIVTAEDVDAARRLADELDEGALRQARAERHRLQTALHRAETAAARAFAHAQTRSAQYLLDRRDQIRTEVAILTAAGGYDLTQALPLDSTATAHLPDLTRRGLTALASTPFTVTPVHVGDEQTGLQAMQIMHRAQRDAGRTVLWCAPDSLLAERARAAGVADDVVTLAAARQHLDTQPLPEHALLIVEHAATAAPEVLRDFAEHAAERHARLILLDDSTDGWPPKPSAPLVRLLHTDLPWSATLSIADGPIARRSDSFDRSPILDQAQHWDSELLTDDLSEALAQRRRLATEHTNAYRSHNSLWTLASNARRHREARERESRDTTITGQPDTGREQ